MAVSIYPLAVEQIKASGQRLPGDVKPDAWDGFHDLIVIDEVARCGYLGIIWALSCGNSIGAPPLINFGNEEQKTRLLPDMLAGKSRFCLGVTEPDGKLALLALTYACTLALTYARALTVTHARAHASSLAYASAPIGTLSYITNVLCSWIGCRRNFNNS